MRMIVVIVLLALSGATMWSALQQAWRRLSCRL